MAERALKNQGTYICAINLFWLDMMRSATPGVPLSRQRVEALATHVFGDGVAAPPPFVKKLLECQALHVAAPMPDCPAGLQMISPDEYCHCILAACAQQLPKHKDRWEIILRSIPCVFSDVPSEKLWVQSWNNRNEISQEFESLSRTALQTSVEVALLKARADKDLNRTLKSDEFSQWLKDEGLKKATNQQEMSKNLIDTALYVYKRIQTDDVAAPIKALENLYGTSSCFNQMTLLHGVLSKPAPQHMPFVVQSIQDWIMRKKVEMSELTKGTLLGDKHVCGYVTLFEYKHQVLNHWITVVVPRAKILEKDRVAIQRALANHQACEQYMWGDDLAWQGSLLPSSLDCLDFLEARMIFKSSSCVFNLRLFLCLCALARSWCMTANSTTFCDLLPARRKAQKKFWIWMERLKAGRLLSVNVKTNWSLPKWQPKGS